MDEQYEESSHKMKNLIDFYGIQHQKQKQNRKQKEYRLRSISQPGQHSRISR